MGDTVLSGIRASGGLHIGNYLGAIRNFVTLSQDRENLCLFFVANLHSLTTCPDPETVRAYQEDIVRMYLACGIVLERSHFYLQHTIPELAAVGWFLGCHLPDAELRRLPTTREKQDKGDTSFALVAYPVLMAADILAVGGTLVPVGEDQKPHIELTQRAARAVNNFAMRYRPDLGQIFQEPECTVNALRVPGLDGTGKMGKSEGNTIGLLDTPETVMAKLKVAVTDPARKRRSDPGDPQVCNIYTLHNQTEQPPDVIAWVHHGCTTAEIGCLECKARLAGRISEILTPIQARHREIDPRTIAGILAAGTAFARPRVIETYQRLCDLHGCTPK